MARVIRPGGVAVVIDNDATTSTFGEWFAQSHPGYDALAVERFWRRAGFTRERLLTSWQARDRAEFQALVRIEFEPAAADRILAEHAGSTVDYAVNVWWRRY
ncbi:Methyltransferase type 11 (fragment) [Nostocoides jenkinsii Ben 74]|uniref:Methyltransferase type 11 n=2 Tax=Nostocoides jenkinsii TaxID=330834 RepID=A0A077MFL6_9MICO